MKAVRCQKFISVNINLRCLSYIQVEKTNRQWTFSLAVWRRAQEWAYKLGIISLYMECKVMDLDEIILSEVNAVSERGPRAEHGGLPPVRVQRLQQK